MTTRRLRHKASGNEAVEGVPDRTERYEMIRTASAEIQASFEVLRLGYGNEHTAHDTRQRVAKVFVRNLFSYAVIYCLLL
jgi:hypothetical protein